MTDPITTAAAESPDRVGLIDAETGERWTFEAYDTAIERATARLSGLGIDSTDRVAILSETRPEVAHVFFACWRLGAIAVPLNARLTASELRTQLQAIDPAVLVASPSEEGLAADATKGTPVYVFGSESDRHPAFSAVESGPVESEGETGDGDVAYLFTSGTTGDPKAVRLTAGNFEAAAAAHRNRLGVDPDERWLCPLSTYHMGGLAILVRSAFYGTAAVLQRTTEGFDPGRTRRVLDEFDCTAISVVPVQLRRLLDDGPLPDSLRFVLCGGAPTPPTLVERAASRGVPICPTYGMTETTSQVATPTPAEARTRPNSVGRPLDSVTVTLVADDGSRVGEGELGEIVVSGPTVSPGYLDGSRTAFRSDGFHTGDVARMDDAGRLTVLNRREDRILTGGENVHPGEVTAVLTDHPGVADAAVLGIPDPEWGERVSALVVTLPGHQLDPDVLQTFARDRLAGYKLPRTIVFVDDLPRTASGTVDRESARALLHQRIDSEE